MGATRQLGVPGRTSDKSDRATVEQALDPRTRMVLFKMLNRGVFSEINGCVSTGKEANVYHAATPDGTSLAIKVYKTSILVFKDREKCDPLFSLLSNACASCGVETPVNCFIQLGTAAVKVPM